MKKNTFLLLNFLLLITFISYGQQERKVQTTHANSSRSMQSEPVEQCATDVYNTQLLQSNPNMMGSENFENFIRNKVEEIKSLRSTSSPTVVVTIPVVVHVIHNGEAVGSGTNISDAQVLSQIQVLNEDYRRLAGTRGYNTHVDGADLEIEFCMAQRKPDGTATNGINRVDMSATSTSWDGPGATSNTELVLKPSTIWDASQYMNMWSVNFTSSSLLGYAQFPGGPSNTDGVVANYLNFGSNDAPGVNLFGSFNLGRTMTHEVGHYLGLYHTFQGGCSEIGGGDLCADTPPVASPNSNSSVCNPNNSCTEFPDKPDMIENYMDYTTDACMNVFTNDQKTRVLAALTDQTRASLLTSNACTPPVPTINFGSTPPSSVNEGSECSYQDIIINLEITEAASANATATLSNSGTAVLGADFDLINNSVTFSAGSITPSNSITLRVYEDAIIENNESIILSVSVSTSGDAVAGSNTYNTSIQDDDVNPTLTTQTLFSDDFESYTDFTVGAVGSWTDLDNDGDSTYPSDNYDFTNEGYSGTFIVFNSSATTPSSAGTAWDSHGGSKGYYCFNSTGNFSGSIQNDDYIFTPQITLTGTSNKLRFWAKGLTDNYAGGERFQVGISTTNTNPSSFTYLTPSPYAQPTLDWAEYVYDLDSMYDGLSVYFTIHVVSADEFVFMLDDISVTTDLSIDVQESVNSGTPDMLGVNQSGMAFSTDPVSGDVMLSVNNTGAFNYGCATVSVSRSQASVGAYSAMYSTPGAANYVTAKTFTVSTSNANSSSNSTIDFYFTEAEIAGWETETGNSRTNLYIKNDDTGELVNATVSAFGSDVKISGDFTMGLAGTYYFGTQAPLNLNDVSLESSLSIYPNPSSNVVTIKVKNSDLPDAYKIYNMLGQLVREDEINNESDLTFDVSTFSNGMYFVKISQGNNSVTIPLIKK